MVTLTAVVGALGQKGHGECWVWQRVNDRVICVDAGRTLHVGVAGGRHRPQILILSHDDHDHIGGAVDLIRAAGVSLEQLWVPVEWAILIKHLADAPDVDLLPDDLPQTPPRIETLVATQLIAAEASGDHVATDGVELDGLLVSAETTLADLAAERDREGPPEASSEGVWRRWYGAASRQEIVDRVRKRATRLIAILGEACRRSLTIRYFSIDLALRVGAKRSWLTAGIPGRVTIANANEAPFWQAVQIPPGIPYTYALSRLTVQNRRALSTLLWSHSRDTTQAVIVWSDSDGNWLNTLSPRGFTHVAGSLLASSAPHHASDNAAHARVWQELAGAPQRMVMICAGGQGNQPYAAEYLVLASRRSCTRCRGHATPCQQVTAHGGTGAGLTLQPPCAASH